MSRQTQSYDDKAIRGEELESLATSIAQKIVDNGQVVAEALDELDARTRALENYNPDVLGDAVADSLDAQVLKIGGQPIDTSAYELLSNKVSSWQTTPDNTHYPSEKLVKDGLDAKADADSVVAIADAFVLRRGQVGQGWYKLAETTTPRANYNINSVFDVVVSTSSLGEHRGSFVMSVRYEGTGVVNVFTKSLFSDDWPSGYPIKIVTTKVSSAVLKVELFFSVSPSNTTNAIYSGISISEQNAGNYGGINKKNAWTYTSYTDVAGSAAPESDPTSDKEVVDVDIVARQHNIASPTENNLVAMDANGLVKDSGLAKSSVESAITSAGSAIQGVKVNNTTLTPDANKVVTVPLATTSANGAMSAADKTKLDGIEAGAEANVQADWGETDTSADDFIKNKPLYRMYIEASTKVFKVCTVKASSPVETSGFRFICRYTDGSVLGDFVFRNGAKLFYNAANITTGTGRKITFYQVTNVSDASSINLYASADAYTELRIDAVENTNVSLKINFSSFGTEVSAIPEGATEITPVWVANTSASSGTAPVKVDAYGALTPVPMDSTPTASSTNLMTSGDIKTALDKKANLNNFRTAVGTKGLKLRFSANANLYDGVFATILNGYGGLAYRSITFGIRRQSNALPSVHRYNTEISSGDYSTGKNFSLYYGTDPSDENYKILLIVPAGSIQGLLNLSTSGTASEWSLLSETPSTDGLTQITPTEHTNVFGANKGSASVPVYVDASGAATPCTDDFVHDGDVAQSYSSSSTAPISGHGVSLALATSLTDVEYVAAQSGGGGNLNKTKNGSTTSVLAFMTTAEATSLWQSAWAAAN